jgi:hypothetical protein
MLETLWAMTNLFFMLGILPAGVLLILYFMFKRLCGKSVGAIVKNIDFKSVAIIFTWICFIGFAGYAVYAVAKG